MDQTTQLQASQGIVFGAFFQLLGWYMRTHAGPRSIFVGGTIGLVLGTIILTRGCMALAESRGHGRRMGLLGLLSVVGLAAIWFLPAKSKQT